MSFTKWLSLILIFISVHACSGRETPQPVAEYDDLFSQMASIPLNDQLTLTGRYDAEADTIDIEVQNHSEHIIWFKDQSFSVESFVFSSESNRWEKFDLGFYVGDPQPKSVPPNAPGQDTYYPVPTLFADIKDRDSLRLLIIGCLDEPCHSDSTKVGAYTDVVINPTGDQPVMSPADQLDEQRIHRSFLIDADLPTGWFRAHFETIEVEKDTVYSVVFLARDQPGLENLTHQIILYPDEIRAQTAYRSKWTPFGKKILYKEAIPEIDFQSRADEFRIGCLYDTSELWSQNLCIGVARYERLISILTAIVYDEEKWFGWADLERTLEAMDRRALEAAGR